MSSTDTDRIPDMPDKLPADFQLTPIGRAVWEDRYALKDSNGKLVEQSILDTFKRVSTAIASAEKEHKKWAGVFYKLMAEKEFCPAGRVLADAGTHFSQLQNCYVIPFKDDSLESIMKTASDVSITQKFGGGCIGPESIVITDKGPVSLKQVVDDNYGTKVLSYNPKTGKTGFKKILARHRKDVDGNRVFKINFDNMKGGVAASIRASDWHPFFVFDGEKIVEIRADKLKKGMAVIGSTALTVQYDGWAWLLGYVAGDGAVCRSNKIDVWMLQNNLRIRIVDMNKECIERAAKVMKVPCYISSDKRYKTRVWCCDAYSAMADKIKNEFGGYQTCFTKHVPSSIWTSSAGERFSFLVGYLDADGTFSKEKKRFEAFTVSEKFAHELLTLSGSLGIRSSLRFRRSRRKNEADGWEIRFSASQYLADCVCSISAKYKKKIVGPVCGVIDFSEVWKDCLMKVGVNVRTNKARRGKTKIDNTYVSLAYWLQYGKATRETASRILRACKKELSANAVLSSQIVRSSKPTNVRETLYDLTVETNQTYIASDPHTGAYVVVHNTGLNYSKLRPEGAYIKGVNGRSCGVIGFIDMMSVVSGVIEQGGSRRGANLGLLEIWHPDIWSFISLKNDNEWDRVREFATINDETKWEYWKKVNPHKLQMYNVSVGIDDDFLKALASDDFWTFKWHGEEWDLYKVVYKRNIRQEEYQEKEFEVVANNEASAIWKVKRLVPYPKATDIFEVTSKRKAKASEVWTKICYNAWANGCPGILNMSTIRRMHNGEYCNPIESTNPCGEQPLPSYGACNLGSLILPTFINGKDIDWDRLAKAVSVSVRFLDDVTDKCDFPLPEQRDVALKERRIGLGTMGVHDMLIKLKLAYDSDKGREIVEKVLKFIRDKAYMASVELAAEKGSFPSYDEKGFFKSGFIETLDDTLKAEIQKKGIRNLCILSQAPTGTIGTMLNISQGCEPWFAMSFDRHTNMGIYVDGCVDYIDWKENNPETKKPDYFKTAMEITPDDHLKMMILFSKYTDAAVSKTINLPNEATVDDVKAVFLKALQSGVKGITIFRDGCRVGVLKSKDEKEEPEKAKALSEVIPQDYGPFRKRGNRVVGATTRVHMDNRNLYVTVNKNYEGSMVELFTTVGESKKPETHHTSGVEDSWAEALGKVVSLALRAGVNPESIIRNLKNIPSDKPVFETIGDNESSELIPSPPHAIARVMEEEGCYIPQKQIRTENKITSKCCQNCGSTRIIQKTATCYECLDCFFNGCA